MLSNKKYHYGKSLYVDNALSIINIIGKHIVFKQTRNLKLCNDPMKGLHRLLITFDLSEMYDLLHQRGGRIQVEMKVKIFCELSTPMMTT